MAPSNPRSKSSRFTQNDTFTEYEARDIFKDARSVCENMLDQIRRNAKLENRSVGYMTLYEKLNWTCSQGHHIDFPHDAQYPHAIFSGADFHIILDNWADLEHIKAGIAKSFSIVTESHIGDNDAERCSQKRYSTYRVCLRKISGRESEAVRRSFQIDVRGAMSEELKLLSNIRDDCESSVDTSHQSCCRWSRSTILYELFQGRAQHKRAKDEDKATRQFSNASEIAEYLRKVKPTRGKYEQSTGPSEILQDFLKVVRKNTRRDLDQLLKGLDSGFERTERLYPAGTMNLVIYLMDQEFGITNDVHPNVHRECDIAVLRTTVIWMDKLFSEFSRRLFITQSEKNWCAFQWLCSPKVCQWLLKSKPSFPNREVLDDLTLLWRWFESHKEPAVKLAFAMSIRGMVPTTDGSAERLSLIFEKLARARGFGPKR
ncbi:RelA/SpoT [Penicillium capsulatum]|uniref:RelA/SpoT n=1 Tax=Penicillium capsulatum TaxID=69766 RepID=A0A9W9I2E3_9EURO|nr:RelA/SpoT [Penicillium capsulatum]KAJ6117214.1 RelA/SpoT [Penicillium capsulatum]